MSSGGTSEAGSLNRCNPALARQTLHQLALHCKALQSQRRGCQLMPLPARPADSGCTSTTKLFAGFQGASADTAWYAGCCSSTA